MPQDDAADRRAIRAGRVINWLRRVPMRARAWSMEQAGQAADSAGEVMVVAASANQAPFAANDPEGIWARAESLRSAPVR